MTINLEKRQYGSGDGYKFRKNKNFDKRNGRMNTELNTSGEK